MDDVILQTVLFFLLVGEGAAPRLLYSLVLALRKKITGKAFAVITDILTAVIGAGCMLLTCLIAAESVRVFYAVFYIGGIALAHLIMRPSARKKRRRVGGNEDNGNDETKPH